MRQPEEDLSLKNSFVQDVAIFLSKTVPNMVKISLSSSANSAVALLNGSVGAILTFATLAISANAAETTSVSTQKTNYRSARGQEHALWEEITMEMERRRCSAVLFVGTSKKTKRTSDGYVCDGIESY